MREVLTVYVHFLERLKVLCISTLVTVLIFFYLFFNQYLNE